MSNDPRTDDPDPGDVNDSKELVVIPSHTDDRDMNEFEKVLRHDLYKAVKQAMLFKPPEQNILVVQVPREKIPDDFHQDRGKRVAQSLTRDYGWSRVDLGLWEVEEKTPGVPTGGG